MQQPDTRPKRIIEAERKFFAKVAEKGWIALTPYVNYETYVYIRCGNNHVFPRKPKHIHDTKGCPDCPTKRFLEVQSKFFQRMKEKSGIMVGEYKKAVDPIKVRCHLGHPFDIKPTVLNNTE